MVGLSCRQINLFKQRKDCILRLVSRDLLYFLWTMTSNLNESVNKNDKEELNRGNEMYSKSLCSI